MVIAGQAVETSAEYRQMLSGEAETTDSGRMISALKPAQVWFSHDQENWERNPQSEIRNPKSIRWLP